MIDTQGNLGDFDFWHKFESERQLSLEESQIKKPERFRKIHRDFKVINQAQQWEARVFLNILNYALHTLNISSGYKGTGRPSLAPLSEKIKICCIKQYNLKGARRSVYDIESARNNGFLFTSTISENFFNRINDYMKDISLTPYLQKLISILSEPLIGLEKNFVPDGSGFKTSCGKRRYKDIRTDKSEKREYIGLHIIAGVKYKIIPHAIVAKGHVHDNNFFKPLVLKANEMFDIKEIYADPAYLSKNNIDLCESLNITPYIKPKENTLIKGLKESAWRKNIDRYYEDKELKEKRRYSLRVNVEATFHMLKSIFSDVLRHRIFEARVNELLCRVICHNIRCLIYAYFKGDIKFPFNIME